MTSLATLQPNLPDYPGAQQPQGPLPDIGKFKLAVRAAGLHDAEGIAKLYRIAYMAKEPGDAAYHYPFPQFMKESWLQEAMSGADYIWYVALADQQVVGAVVGVCNIGNGKQVAEVCGLVVLPTYRRRGLATRLLTALHAVLVQDCDLILAETRTAEAGGWKTFCNFGYAPLGFEPAAHRTPSGFEPMLLQGLFPNSGAVRQGAKRGTAAVQALREAVAGVDRDRPIDSAWFPATSEVSVLKSAVQMSIVPADPSMNPFPDARFPFQGSRILPLCLYSGNGDVGERFIKARYLAVCAEQPLAMADVLFDRVDRRARIIDLRTVAETPPLLGVLLRNILSFWNDGPSSVAIDLYADDEALQAELQSMGFFPTAYYPAIASRGETPVDGVQMAYLHGFKMEDNLVWGRQVDWPRAQLVIRRVALSAPE